MRREVLLVALLALTPRALPESRGVTERIEVAYLTKTEVTRLNVSGLLPDMLSKATELMSEVERELGLKMYIPVYGGFRSARMQRQLLRWREQADADYAVASAGNSHHEAGAAIDLRIVDPAQRTDANYRRIAEISRRLGLVPGYFFSNSDPYHHQLSVKLAEAKAAWQEMLGEQVAND